MFIDSHCHFNFDCFDADREKLISSLGKVKVDKLIIPGTDANRWPDIIELVAQHSHLYYALGIHPHFLNSFEETQLTELQSLLTKALASDNHHCVALGEIGLDKLITTDLALQETVFLKQLAIAELLKLPVILHVVKTQSRILALLKQHKFSYGGVYHAFSGSIEVANEFIKLGFKLGIGGVITYPNAHKTRLTVSQLPLSCFVLETDAPDMPIYQQQAVYNSPGNLPIIFDSLCKLRKESAQSVSAQIYENTSRIFPLIND